MQRWAGKVAVVTGASAGIGLVTAKVLLEKGMVVVGLARRKAKMEEGIKNATGRERFQAVECDVSSEDSVIKAFEFIKKNIGSVHILVNNAGGLIRGGMLFLKTEQLEQTINVNILGLLYCTRQAIDIMKEGNHEGHIVNVGSYLSHKVLNVPGLYLNVYPATKFAVRALSETLQNEIRSDKPPTKIRVTHISPGVVKTDFFEAAGVDPTFPERNPALEAVDVADAIVYAISTRAHVQIPEITLLNVDDQFR